MLPKLAVGPLSRWELAAETIAVKIRWFGLVIGYLVVNAGSWNVPNQTILNAILTLGLIYSVIDTVYSLRGTVFLHRYPLLISLMEAFFIGLLCYYHEGLESPFRYYYFLSLICCAIRHSAPITYLTCTLHWASYTLLFFALPQEQGGWLTLILTLVILGWVTWAASSLAQLLKRVGDHLSQLNSALKDNQTLLEARIAERTLQLQEAQALVQHQEKMAGFGLLAAGIAHEVGNPLTSISSIVQILQRRGGDDYTLEKLDLVSGQLKRIQITLRELINFSRPATMARSRATVQEVVDEALNIAKYYKRTKERRILRTLEEDLPLLFCKKEMLMQAVLNLVFNAIDATDKHGQIEIEARTHHGEILLSVRDNGQGIPWQNQQRIFQPYFTTKRDGTGLGLFVTQKLAAEHDGQVTFTSSPGGGTTFTLHLPLEAITEPILPPKRPLQADLGWDPPALSEVTTIRPELTENAT